MSKQTFKIGKNFIPNILVLSSSAVLALFAALILVAPVTETTGAVVIPNLTDGLSLVTNKTIEANIHPEENGSLNIIKDTIVGSTNSSYGYEIYISANSDTENSIYLNGNPENSETTQKIIATTGTYDAPAALDLTNGATWGYAIAGLDNFDASYNIYTPSASAKFAAMPTVDSKQLIHSSSTAVSDDTLDIYYGIDADSTLEPGIYKTEILYTALPIIPPSTAKAILGDNGNLNFVYDYNTYTVGETYADNLAQPTEITAIYDVPLNSSRDNLPLWITIDEGQYPTTNPDVVSVNFDESFSGFKPVSTSYWFYMFNYVESITNIENLDTSEVTDASYMFYWLGSQASTLDIGNVKSLDVRNVVNAYGMFYGFGESVPGDIVLNLDGMNFASAVNMGAIFEVFGRNAANVTLSLKNWNVPNVQDLSQAFWDVGQYSYNGTVSIDVSGWILGSLLDTNNAFESTAYSASEFILTGISDWNMSTVTDAHYMFHYAAAEVDSLNIEIKNWNLSSAENLYGMFFNFGYYVKNSWHLDVSGWTFGNDIDNSSSLFLYAGYGYSSTLQTWSINVSNWTFGTNMSLQTAFAHAGSRASSWTMVGTSTWKNTNNLVNLSSTFNDAGHYSTSWAIDSLSNWNVSNVTTMSQMFYDAAYNATTFNLGDLSQWDTGQVTTMYGMFCFTGWDSGANFYIGDISGWDVDNVTDHDIFIHEDSGNPHGVIEPNWQPQP